MPRQASQWAGHPCLKKPRVNSSAVPLPFGQRQLQRAVWLFFVLWTLAVVAAAVRNEHLLREDWLEAATHDDVALAQAKIWSIAGIHAGLWALGVLGIFLGGRQIRRHRLDRPGRMKEKLQQSEGRIRAITDSAQDAILMMDPGGRVSYWNPAAERIFGFTSAEALGKNLHEYLAPDRFQAAHHAAYPAFRQTGQGAAIGKTLDLKARRKDGQEIFIQLSLSSIQMDDGWHAVGIIRDITERRRMEDKLRQLSMAVEQSPASVVITDPAGNIEYVNPKFMQSTGYIQAEVLGKNPCVLKSGEQSPETYRELWQTITSGKEWHGEFHNKKKNGELYWESASISPIRDLIGRITHFVAVKEDITARKLMEAERDRLLQITQIRLKTLSGLLPSCAGCKKIRDDKGYWNQVEGYIQEHSEATFSHGMCPECMKKHYPDF